VDYSTIHALFQKVDLMSELRINTNGRSAPVLSICIPTFNREVFLRECLDSLEHSLVPEVEIVVSDNASTDGTIELLDEYARRLPLRWRQNLTNVGFDRNVEAVVSMAHGRYCWLLGSDDCVTPGALRKVVDQLRRNEPDILHFGYTQADIAMRPLSRVAPTAALAPVVMTPKELPEYLGSLPNVSLLFAFISSFAFRRDQWFVHADRLPGWLDSHYVHAYMVHAMLAAGVTVLPSDDLLVIARGGNPNEFNTSAGRMLALDAVTLDRIHREIYREPSHLLALGSVFRKSYRNHTIIRIAAQGGVPQLLACYPSLKLLGVSRPLIRSLQLASSVGLMPLLRQVLSLRNHLINSFTVLHPNSKR
jgi:abequosyltransferase